MSKEKQTNPGKNPLLGRALARAEEQEFRRVEGGKNIDKFPFADRSSEEVVSVYNRKSEIQIDFYKVPNSSNHGHKLTILISRLGQLLEFVTSTDDPEQLRRARAILGFDLMEKPAGQETGTPLSRRDEIKRIKRKIMGGR